MEIRLNDKILDASLDNEKTIGEVLTVMEQWLSSSGHILSGISVDGVPVKASEIEETFKRDITSVKCIDVQTNPISELTASSLITLLDDINEFEKLKFEDKTNYFNRWKETACGRFISKEISDLFELCVRTFSNGDMTPQSLSSVAEEMLREVTEPVKEFGDIEPVLNEICEMLVDLPLDIQTGKDMKAARTIQLFTAVTEKIYRIFYQMDIQGYINNGQKANNNLPQSFPNKEQIIRQITEFTDVLKELLEAYEKNDSVLVGDLAEYEASVKIKELYTAITENCRSVK